MQEFFKFDPLLNGSKGLVFIGEKLLVYRRDGNTKSYPFYIDLPGGGKESEETPFQTFQREVEEEFGLKISESDITYARKYPSTIVKGEFAYFPVVKLPAEAESLIHFGDEGLEYLLITLDEFLEFQEVWPYLQLRAVDYLTSTDGIKIHSAENSDVGNLLLDVPMRFVQIPEWLKKSSGLSGFSEKSEYHVTVIGRDLAAKIIELEVTDQVESLARSFEWNIEFLQEYIELAKDDDEGVHRQSIVQIVKVSEFVSFFDQLEIILKQPIRRPPAHITIYTKNYDKGIGIYSDDDLMRYSVKTLLG